ncbi:hypothetical protein SORBI_3001G166750 [Sorghum bicolor]|uniref:Uncharacterized protein n=1 Tax=Sorghum bicolor TaxID=4558 RepID=A0A1Z5S622_SORBI|nr:hypothetical protein SORBI_3001G166750 [Sorghum bicolor]
MLLSLFFKVFRRLSIPLRWKIFLRTLSKEVTLPR